MAQIIEDKKPVRTMHRHYTIAFWITLSVALGLFIGGFFMPPVGEVDGSVLSGIGEIFLWPALAFGGKALEEGKVAKIRTGNTSITVGKKEDHHDDMSESMGE